MTLVILAAGLGSRYGGEKQTDGLGPSGEWLMEYAFYDAIQAGFDRVLLVVRAGMQEQLEKQLPKRWGKLLSFSYVTQHQPLASRTKPWGTAHAAYCASCELAGGFALINADDFYGREAFEALATHLKQNKQDPSAWAMVSYPLADTLSQKGSVSRGLCRVDANGYLLSIEEYTQIEASAQGPMSHKKALPKDTAVSMNCWAFGAAVQEELQRTWSSFFAHHREDPTIECYLPEMVMQAINTKRASVKVLEKGSKWLGVTYAEEAPGVSEQLATLHQQGVYPTPLQAEKPQHKA